MRRRRRVLVVLLGSVFALLLGELGLRLVPAKATGFAHHRCDRLLGWRGIPGERFTLTFPDGPVRILRNRRGMHDVEHAEGRAAAGQRVMLLGDSFVEALQVEESRTHRRLLEEALGASAEVLAAGVGGWSLAQELLYFESEGARYRPDVVVLF